MACGISVLQPGLEPGLQQRKPRILTTRPPGNSPTIFFKFMAALGLHCCVQAFSNCVEWGLLFVVVRGLLIVVASLAVEHGL